MSATTEQEAQDDAAATATDAAETNAATSESTVPVAEASSQPPASLPAAAEFEPPLACVRRILKHALPSSTNVGKDASAAFARASGIFIIYVTACANDFARENKRQTITANDVLAAVTELDFEEFTPDMQSFLESYRSAEKNKKSAKAAAVAAKQGLVQVPSPVSAASSSPAKATDELSDDEEDEDDTATKEDAVVESEVTPLPDRKRPREDDETDSEGGDDAEEPSH